MFDNLYSVLIYDGAWQAVLNGLLETLKISFFALILGTLLGLGICALRMSRFKPFSVFSYLYISVLRGSPLTMLLMLLYYCVFSRTHIDAMWIAVITFGINTSAYIAEMFRTAINTVNIREVEAALTLGFSKFQVLRYVVLPQAICISKPIYQSIIINMIQWTSVVGYVTITDLTKVINNISSRTMQPMLFIIVGMILYIIVTFLVMGIFSLTDALKTRKKGVHD